MGRFAALPCQRRELAQCLLITLASGAHCAGSWPGDRRKGRKEHERDKD